MPWKYVYDPELTREVRKLVKDMDLTTLAAIEALPDVGDVLIATMEKRHTTVPLVIKCPRCGSEDTMKYGIRNGTQEYICRGCNRKFNTHSAPFRGRAPAVNVGAAVGMFYGGMSLAEIARQLDQNMGTKVNPATVYRWVIRYTKEAIELFEHVRPNVSPTRVADETVVRVAGKKVWFWDCIDYGTRYLLGAHLSVRRGMTDASKIFQKIQAHTDVEPKTILTDGLNSYIKGIQGVFGYPKPIQHIRTRPFGPEINTNLIERFHGTLKARYKVMRGLKTMESAALLLEGFTVHYNFFRPHMTLENQTPAQAAGIDMGCASWVNVVKGSCTAVVVR